MNQPTLFTQRSKLEAEFDRFDSDHVDVWLLFRRFALDAIAAGRSRFSADAILHRIRWFTTVEAGAPGASVWKINDHYSAFYARKFVRLMPEHQSLFELRQRRERAGTVD